ncbi:beta-sandwich domain-containing protein [Bdellovibrio sp. NC01]|uniref:beta-sandwich domain-containing protein n=1 Tax=Bdellovibrio sp. NC01 TaxID=2220073 RepID=UPI001158DE6E|nr:beta-sandwich domain-containing protein [Bdellovibrio sp. NC01]QDK38493.1 hypothetical protein DOE51_13350 [Bdellovibrio sp. NC01]
MKRFFAGFLATMAVVQHAAHAAENLVDLPGFDSQDTQVTTTPATPTVAPQTPSVERSEFAGTLLVKEVPRKSGGTLLKISLKQALSLKRLELAISKSSLKVYKVTAFNDNGQAIALQSLTSYERSFAAGTVVSSQLNQSDRIAKIEILAESYGGEADLTVNAVADREVPKLVLTDSVLPAPLPPPVDTVLRRGDEVISGPFQNNQYYYGTVLEIFANGKVNVRDNDDGKNYVRDMTAVNKKINCNNTGLVCIGQKVLSGPFQNNAYYNGEVTAVYTNGLIAVRDNDDNKTYLRKSDVVITPLARCNNSGHCVGDKVLSGPFQNNAYYNGQIEAMYSNGLIAVRDQDDGKLYYREARLVLKSVRCDAKSDLCIGTSVLSGPFQENKYYQGRIEGIYSNGLIYVRDQDDNKLYPRQANNMFREIKCEASKGICKGARVLSGPYQRGAYYAGTVLAVYVNDKILVRDDDDGKNYIRPAKELFKAQ